MLFPVQADTGEGLVQEFPHGVGFPGGDHVVVGRVLLEHEPHGLHVLLGVAPVASRVDVAEVELVLEPGLDHGGGPSDLPRHEGLPAPGGLVVEQDPVAGEQAVALAIVDGHPVGIRFGGRVGASRIEGRCLALGHLPHLAVHLGAARLVELRGQPGLVDGLQDAHGAQGRHVARVLGDVEAHADVALGGEVVDLVGPHPVQELDQVGRVADVTVVQEEPDPIDVGILVEMVDALGIEGGGAADDAVDLVAFAEEELGEIRAVLAGDARDERFHDDATLVPSGDAASSIDVSRLLW